MLPLVQLNLAGARALVYAVHKLGNAILTADGSAASLETFKSTSKTSLFTKLYSWDAQITHGQFVKGIFDWMFRYPPCVDFAQTEKGTLSHLAILGNLKYMFLHYSSVLDILFHWVVWGRGCRLLGFLFCLSISYALVTAEDARWNLAFPQLHLASKDSHRVVMILWTCPGCCAVVQSYFLCLQTHSFSKFLAA